MCGVIVPNKLIMKHFRNDFAVKIDGYYYDDCHKDVKQKFCTGLYHYKLNIYIINAGEIFPLIRLTLNKLSVKHWFDC